ncbi:MAG: hypothetical protein HQL31_04810, partial [Planctomycetes bacterium]|nr:hypothetical protein [Planctomycetota bacterium]
MSFSLNSILGLSILIFTGGVAHLFKAIGPIFFFSFISIGWLFALRLRVYPKLWKINIWESVAWFCLLTMAFTALYTPHLNTLDDHFVYMPLVESMLQMGSMDEQPFLMGRLVVALGGHTLLLACTRSFVDWHFVSGLDNAFGLLLVAGILARSKPGNLGVLATFLFLALYDFEVVNCSSVIMGMAMAIGTCEMIQLTSLGKKPYLKACLPALLQAALITQKMIWIIPCAMITLGWWSWIIFGKKEYCWRTIAWNICFVMIFLSPWMLSSSFAAGTPLYPVLGKGDTTGNFGLVPMGFSPTLLKNSIVLFLGAPQVLLALLLCGIGWKQGLRSTWLMGTSILLSSFFVFHLSFDMLRYIQPILCLAILLFFLAIQHSQNILPLNSFIR